MANEDIEGHKGPSEGNKLRKGKRSKGQEAYPCVKRANPTKVMKANFYDSLGPSLIKVKAN